MTARSQQKGFTLAHLEGVRVRDQDNAGTRPAPPFTLDHPRLAPPGMSGVRGLPAPTLPPVKRRPERAQMAAAKVFKPIARARGRDGPDIDR